jgi:hypothetical protein
VGLASWFRALGSERSYLEKGTLAVPAMSSETERCFRGTKLGIPETRKRLDWTVIEASEVSRGLMKYECCRAPASSLIVTISYSVYFY